MRFVSQVEWELLKRHTAAHLQDRAWPYGAPRQAAVAAPTPPRRAEPDHYFSGNYPGKTAE
jgi:hypothetical protein